MVAVVHLVAGARPNFMKIVPLHRVLVQADWAKPVFVHTGQHYDTEMSHVFVRELGLPEPSVHLESRRRREPSSRGRAAGARRTNRKRDDRHLRAPSAAD